VPQPNGQKMAKVLLEALGFAIAQPNLQKMAFRKNGLIRRLGFVPQPNGQKMAKVLLEALGFAIAQPNLLPNHAKIKSGENRTKLF
jgi:hypothetical protein